MRHNYLRAGKDTVKGEPPLQIASRSTPESLVRQIWLHYFNDYLFSRKIITEDEWRKMRRLIGVN